MRANINGRWMVWCLASLLSSAALAGGSGNSPAVPAPTASAYPGVISLSIQATDLAQRVFSVKERIPVKAGPLVLLYPQWVPGSHAPIGAITQLTGLQFSAQTQTIPWRRDPLDPFAFHVDIPKGVTTLEAEFAWVSPLASSQGRTVVTPDMLHLQFDHVLLYPAGVQSDGIQFSTNVTLPSGWQQASALELAERKVDTYFFKNTNLTNLVDSPLMAGRYFKQIDLAPESGVPVRISAFAERDDALQMSDKAIEAHKAVVQQAAKLFGPPPFAHFDFLLAMSDGIGGIGREHWQSTEITTPANYFAEVLTHPRHSYVMPHEFVHAWNGKYRRPADLITANLNVPMQNSLLWVYEGQTQYWGSVLQARAKMITAEGMRDTLAASLAGVAARPGRSWRDLQDTVNDPIMGWRDVPRAWTSWQRGGGDYYAEGSLLWLGIDARIRSLSNETRSLDDFAALFFADAPAAKLVPRAYRLADVVATLNKVAPYDWQTHLMTRLGAHDDQILQQDLPLTGWKLVYTKTPNAVQTSAAKESGVCDASNSLGLTVSKTDALASVVWESIAFKAGLAPGMTLLAVNGKVFKCSELNEAITAAQTNAGTIDLIVRREREVKLISLAYQGGLRYPHLERIASLPDRLSKIIEAR